MVWRYGEEGASHKIWPGSIQRFPRNLSLRTDDGRRTTDACAMTVALLTKSSRAKNKMQDKKVTVLKRKYFKNYFDKRCFSTSNCKPREFWKT